MHFSAGTLIRHYEILDVLGEGGMGVVYRARDTRLGREIAVKILPLAVASDPDRIMRFEREARTLASLSHPNIATLHGVEETPARPGQPPLPVLVMELVEGDDLSARIASGPLPVAEALAIARQIADALAAAHDVGIVHRDLKPANVKIKADGSVKVLDFGLARVLDSAASPAGAPTALATSPTVTSPALTHVGVILGTGAYMAPEQAKGQPVDRRADVWAFGVVLYEMLTGKRIFDRSDVSETLAAVLTVDPDLRLLPPATPPQIHRLLARCLAKDKRHRLDSMSAVRFEIEDALGTPPTAEAAPSKSPVTGVVVALVIAAFALGAIAALLLSSRGPRQTSSSGPVVSEIPAPRDIISSFSKGFALSPDGQSLVFVARSPNGVRQLWLRRLAAPSARPIANTEEALHPFWSPDGAHIAFFTETKLRRIPAEGGEPQTICDVFGSFASGSWSVRDEILFGAGGGVNKLYTVPAGGGTPTAVDRPGEPEAPVWLPDGNRYLYFGGAGEAWGVYLATRDGGSPKLIARQPLPQPEFAYAATGYLLMNRGDVLTAQKLDADAGTLAGPVVTIAGSAGTPLRWFAVSSSADRLVGYVKQFAGDISTPGDPWAKLQWFTRQGIPAEILGDTARYWTLSLSPDGARVATNFTDDIWILSQGRRTRVTAGPGTQFMPVWSPDGTEIAYRNAGSSPTTVMRKRLDREAQPVALPGIRGLPTDWSRDGRFLLLDSLADSAEQRDIWVYDLAEHKGRPWLATAFNEHMARISPDGNWVAYASNSTGRSEIYVRRFDGSGSAIPVSSDGGTHPRWRRAGHELYFMGPADEMMAADVSATAASFAAGTPHKLFAVPLNDLPTLNFPPYDVSADGQRFLLNVPDRPEPLFFLQGLDALMRIRKPGGE
jgi:serine/threonine protein kinase